MPGPRKNLTPLDMKMLGLAYNQGGIINFLGKQPEVTAPIRAQSHADSPPTQLAYITDAEKDLLVNANIHGSMDGKPNPGPAGLPSLDDFYTYTDDKGKTQVGGGSTANQGAGGGYSGSYGDDAGVTIDVTTPEGQKKREEFRKRTGSTIITEAEKKAREKAEEEAAATTAQGEGEGEGLLDIFKNIFTKKELSQLGNLQLKAAQNMLNQFQELGVTNPLVLRNLMTSNVLGGIFGKDQTFSDMSGNIIDPETVSEGPDGIFGMNEDGELVPVRRTREGAIDQMKETFGDDIMERLKMNYPDIGYTALGGYMPQTSGALADLGGKAALQKTADGKGYITPDGRTRSIEAGENYNKMIFDARMELDRMGKDMFGNTQGGGQGGGGGSYIPPVTPPVDPTDPTDPIPPQQPTLPPGITPLNPSTRFPDSVIRDYTQLGLPQIYGNQQMPNYATFNRAGSMPVGLQNYLDALRNRFGIG